MDRWGACRWLFLACEVEMIGHELRADHHSARALTVGVLATAAMTFPLLWRRRAPLAAACVEMAALVLLLFVVRNDTATLNVPQLLLFVLPYSLAAYAERRRAVMGLGVFVVGMVLLNLEAPGGATSWVFSLGVGCASWGVGRFTHSQRSLAAELQRTSHQITVETESRERLAVAEQRTRIARELQNLVADNVSSMIVQAQAAQLLLRGDLAEADAAMATIEETGRSALNEMRLILGVLRRADQPADLVPQPGVGQIPALVDKSRNTQRHVTLRVQGEPGPLPASVDLGMYRILQDAIAIDETASLDIRLTFGDDSVDLLVTSASRQPEWPTTAMRERVALCEGELELLRDGDNDTLVVRLPRVLRGVLA